MICMKTIKTWEDLVGLENDKYKLEIDLEYGSGWIRPKHNKDEISIYLSTHTFYEGNHEYSSKLLQKYGFDVQLESWG